MDYLSLKKHVGEIAAMLADRPLVTRAVDCSGRSFAFQLKRKGGGWSSLVLNLDNPDQGLRITDKAAELDKNSSLVRTANRLLTDSRLISLDLAGSEEECRFDRVVRLHFVAIDSFFGNRSDYYLFCEFTGRIADIFICDAEQKILDRLSRTSNNLIGATYRLPGSMPLLNPFKASARELITVFAAPPSEWKTRLGALSPDLQATLLARLDSAGRENAAEVFARLLADITADSQAHVYHDAGKVRAISGYRLEHLAGFQKRVFACLNDALNWVNDNFVAARRMNERKKHCIDMISREIRQKERLLAEQRNLLAKYSDSDHYRHYGDLLVANLYQIKPGSRFVELEDWQTSQSVRIELDPARAPSASAQRFFNLYKKAQRGIAEVEKRIKVLSDDLTWLREQLWLAETAENEADLLPDLKSLESTATGRGGRRDKSGGRGNRRRPDFKPVLEIDGCRYYAGRNARQNDALTFQLARRGDYWFHANDVPGAHVILRKAEGEVSEADIYRGAVMAAWFSFARESSKVPVDYADVAHVKRIPGGGPGRVSYTNQKTLLVDPSAAKPLLDVDQ
ncbi:MAG: hypothetical protein CVV42_03955 [Candidatus Riflebacteria bacterium HGW-Riflebacteria-2]|jgi:predicted ribosome quality control (RQC) complex YloA/Tae2 family protein|nr:MAG: hypothetical protein CVV42_03955 [Candidatus Riflebacteria bacterium HGW-Riflebacteria-2]